VIGKIPRFARSWRSYQFSPISIQSLQTRRVRCEGLIGRRLIAGFAFALLITFHPFDSALLRSGQALSLVTSSLVTPSGVAVLVQNIRLRTPKILLRFIRLRLPLPLLLHGGEAFGFLGSSARGIGALAAGESGCTDHYGNKFKVLHIYNYIMNRARL